MAPRAAKATRVAALPSQRQPGSSALPLLNPCAVLPSRPAAGQPAPVAPECPPVAVVGAIRERTLDVGAPSRRLASERGFPQACHRDSITEELRNQLRGRPVVRGSCCGAVAPPTPAAGARTPSALDRELIASGVGAENAGRLAEMNGAEIAEARQKLVETLDPDLYKRALNYYYVKPMPMQSTSP